MNYAYTDKPLSKISAIFTVVIITASNSFLLRMVAWAVYNPAIPPENQDYVYDMMAISELSFVFSAFMMTYLTNNRTKGSVIIRSIFRTILFATLFSTGKEVSGLNTTNMPFEYFFFCITILSSGYFSIYRIRKWQTKKA